MTIMFVDFSVAPTWTGGGGASFRFIKPSFPHCTQAAVSLIQRESYACISSDSVNPSICLSVAFNTVQNNDDGGEEARGVGGGESGCGVGELSLIHISEPTRPP